MSVAPEPPPPPSQRVPSSTPTQAQTFFFTVSLWCLFKHFFPSTFFSSLPSVAGLHFLFSPLLSNTNAFLRFISSFTGQILLCIRSPFQHIVWSSYLFLDATQYPIYLSICLSKKRIFSLSFSPSLASLYLFEQCLRLGVTSTSSVCLPLQDESLYVFPNCKSLWIKASAKWLNVKCLSINF